MVIKLPAESFPILHTSFALLRKLEQRDARALYKIFSDPEVTRYHELAPFISEHDAKALIAMEQARYKQGLAIRWAVAPTPADILIGTCGLVLDHDNQSAEVGYDLSRPYWNKGIMTAVLNIVINFSFESLAINRLQALVMEQNLASIRVLEKLGFQHEGTLRQYALFKGKFHDMECFALLRGDLRYRLDGEQRRST